MGSIWEQARFIRLKKHRSGGFFYGLDKKDLTYRTISFLGTNGGVVFIPGVWDGPKI